MKKVFFLMTIVFFFVSEGSFINVCSQQSELPGEPNDASTQDLEGELEKTLKKIKIHYGRVQNSLEETDADRDPTLDAAINELEKDRNSMIERLEGLAQVLLNAGEEGERESEDPPDLNYEVIEAEFREVLDEMQAYIDERQQYWEGREIDGEQMLREELERLIEEQEILRGMVDGLAEELGEVWEEVKSGWSDKLKEWEDLIRDLFGGDE